MNIECFERLKTKQNMSLYYEKTVTGITWLYFCGWENNCPDQVIICVLNCVTLEFRNYCISRAGFNRIISDVKRVKKITQRNRGVKFPRLVIHNQNYGILINDSTVLYLRHMNDLELDGVLGTYCLCSEPIECKMLVDGESVVFK